MPEIAEVFRAADYIRQHLVGKTLAKVKALHDENVFGKVGTSAAEIEKSVTGKKVVGAGQQGKYFWIAMSSPPHLLCHFGMNGWFHIKGIPTFYYKDTKKDKTADKEWPPRSWKILFETKPEGKDKTVLEAAFVDSRRFARVRLIDVPVEEIRKHSPLKENGPDPNTDKALVTREWLAGLCHRKKAPIKAVLLDQANISGIGNWVGDEILYQSRIHPEQYSNTLSEEQITELHKQLMEVVRIAIETKSDSDKFPKTWLFKHRWGKGRKSVYEMPNGDEITYVTVGGRTSAIVPRLQKKTGPVAGEVEESDEVEAEVKLDKGRKRKAPEYETAEAKSPGPAKRGRRSYANVKNEENDTESEIKEVESQSAKRGRKAKPTTDEIHDITESSKRTLPSRRRKTKVGLEADNLLPTATAEEVAEEEASEQVHEQKPASSRGKKSKNTKTAAETATEEPDVPDKTSKARRGQKSRSKKAQVGESTKPETIKASTQTGDSKQNPVPEINGRRRSGRLSAL